MQCWLHFKPKDQEQPLAEMKHFTDNNGPSSYGEIPYPGRAYPETHPDRLASAGNICAGFPTRSARELLDGNKIMGCVYTPHSLALYKRASPGRHRHGRPFS